MYGNCGALLLRARAPSRSRAMPVSFAQYALILLLPRSGKYQAIHHQMLCRVFFHRQQFQMSV